MTAEIRPRSVTRPKDSIVALDMFSGCGGSSQGIEAAGIDVWYAANHWRYAVEVHEANHPGAEHFIADLVDDEASDYYHPEHLPRADVLWASPSCTNHTKSNSQRAYRENLSLFAVDDEEYEADVTTSERSRATAVCVLQYARKHRPKLIVVENVVEFAQWGDKVPGKAKGDGTTFVWWLSEFGKLGYAHEVLFLNSMFFPPTPQSRDRMYVCMWDRSLAKPDLTFAPEAWCIRCDRIVQARQRWKARTKTWPLEQWGKYGDQYVYDCPSCSSRVFPVAWPAASAIDWSDLGTRIGDRSRPLAPTTMARIARGVKKFGDWPPFIMPAKAMRGVDRSVADPLATQTTQQEAMLIAAFQAQLAGNTFERPGSTCRSRGLDEPMWTQDTTQTQGFVAHPASGSAIDNWTSGTRSPGEPLPAQATHETLGLLGHPFVVKNNGDLSEAGYRAQTILTERGVSTIMTERHVERTPLLRPVSEPLLSVTASGNHHFLLSLFAKQNGEEGDTAWHRVWLEALNTLTGRDTTCVITPADLPPVAVEDCLYRMLNPDEIKAGMGLEASFVMWGSARDKVRALGNAVTPPVSKWLMERMAAVL